jgi:hypothetical protein
MTGRRETGDWSRYRHSDHTGVVATDLSRSADDRAEPIAGPTWGAKEPLRRQERSW